MNLLPPIHSNAKSGAVHRTPPSSENENKGVAGVAATLVPETAARPVDLSSEACDALAVFSPEGSSKLAEQFRTLRVRLLTLPKPPQVIVISSPMGGDGKTFTALNLAASLAFPARDKVLLIDADLRRSAIHSRLGIPQTPGLREVLDGSKTLAEAVISPVQLGGLSVLPAGETPSDPTAILGGPAWNKLMAELRQSYRRIIIDAPPTEGIGDFSMIVEDADGVILICRIDHTNRSEMNRSIRSSRDKLLGVLFNGLPEEFLSKSPSTQYYRQPYRAEPKR